MVKNMEDHTAIQKGRAPTAPQRKAHTAIRSGELPRGFERESPLYESREISFCHHNGRAHTATRTGEPGWYLDGGAHTAIRMGEPTPGVVASANPKRESSHCIQTKRSPAGLGKRGKAEY